VKRIGERPDIKNAHIDVRDERNRSRIRMPPERRIRREMNILQEDMRVR